MDIQAARRVPSDCETIGASSPYVGVCRYWRAGKCSRNPCRFLHAETTLPNACRHSLKPWDPERISKPHEPKSISKLHEPESISNPKRPKSILKPQESLCQYWASGKCARGEKCLFLHSWYRCKDLTLLAKLQGHKKGIVGIGLPSGSDQLFSGSKDGTVKIWNCHTGQCSRTVNMGQEVRSLICEGSWVFIGLINVIKAWNIQSSASFELERPVGQIYAITAFNDLLFAGGQTGDILVWRGSSQTSPLQVASLKGHTNAVTSLIIGAGRLYSSSMDKTIKIWDIDSLVCLKTLKGHTDAVMSLLCWDEYLLSCSLDRTIKVWVATKGGDLEVLYNHTEDHGVLSLKGMHDEQGKPVLLCARDDNILELYDLPTFMERGKIFSRREISAVQTSHCGLFFTGHGCGSLNVWKWSEQSQALQE